jgi:hypothetical protein
MSKSIVELPHSGAPRVTWKKKKDGRQMPVYTYRNARDAIRASESESVKFKATSYISPSNNRPQFQLVSEYNDNGQGPIRCAFISNKMKIEKPMWLKRDKGENADTRCLVKLFADLPPGHVLANTIGQTDDTYDMWVEFIHILRVDLEREVRKRFPGLAAYNFNEPKNRLEFPLPRIDEVQYDEDGNKTEVRGFESPDELFKKLGKPIVILTPWVIENKEGEKAGTVDYGIKPSLVMDEKYMSDAEIRMHEAEMEVRNEKLANTFVPPPAPKKRKEKPVESEGEERVEKVKKARPPKTPKESATSESEAEAPVPPKKKKVKLAPPPTEESEVEGEEE